MAPLENLPGAVVFKASGKTLLSADGSASHRSCQTPVDPVAFAKKDDAQSPPETQKTVSPRNWNPVVVPVRPKVAGPFAVGLMDSLDPMAFVVLDAVTTNSVEVYVTIRK